MLCRTLHSLVRSCSTLGGRRGDCELTEQNRYETAWTGVKSKCTGQQRAAVVRSVEMVWNCQAVISCWKPAKEPHQFHMHFKATPAVQ